MIGVYKITSPTKRVYIGQSIDVERRIAAYKRMDNCSGQIKLLNSFKKYGTDRHKFDILTECDVSELNKWERYYQDLYSCIGKNGLNCLLTGYKDRSGVSSDETKVKISKAGIGRVHSEKTKEKMRLSTSRAERSDETKNRISQTRKDRKIKAWNKGIPRTQEVKDKLRASRTGKASGVDHHNSKLVFNPETGIYYYSIIEAARAYGVYHITLANRMKGKSSIKTVFKIV